MYITSQVATFSCSFWLLTALKETKRRLSPSCVKCHFWSRKKKIMAHFRYQQEPTPCSESAITVSIRLLITALVLFWHVHVPLLKIGCMLIYSFFPVISFYCCWVRFFRQHFATKDLSKTLDCFWPPDTVNCFSAAQPLHKKKYLPFYLGTQCQNDTCRLGRNTSHILTFPNLFWIAGPKMLFGCWCYLNSPVLKENCSLCFSDVLCDHS